MKKKKILIIFILAALVTILFFGWTELQYCQGEFLEDCAGRSVRVQGFLRKGIIKNFSDNSELSLENPSIPSKEGGREISIILTDPTWLEEGFINKKVEVTGKVIVGDTMITCLEGDSDDYPGIPGPTMACYIAIKIEAQSLSLE